MSAACDYLDNSALVEQITFATNGTTVMTTTKGYDFLNRLTNISSLNAQPSTIGSFAYVYNPANQRTSVTNADGSYWVYSHDSMGQVTSGRKYWGDGTAIAGQQFDYTFDDIGNRKTATRDTRAATYTPNNLNQYTSRTVPGYVNVLGTATNIATVSLWSKESTALYTSTTRKGDYFRGEVPFNNSTGALWLTITNVAVLSNYASADIVTNIAGSMLLAKTPEAFGYDADGNLTNDSLWAYTWDAENRLVKQENVSSLAAAGKRRIEFAYDHQSRRIQKLVSTNNGSGYVAESTNRFVYDGWNLVATLNPQLAAINSFVWGLDLSGSLQGAGGVGGLLIYRDQSTLNPQPSTHFVAYDGNGNVASLVNATNGVASASYEYGPLGEVLRASGSMAKANPFRFSTKYQDHESDYLYYGYRSYNPAAGRWPNRDPIAENGGLNLYGFVYNNPIGLVDTLGEAVFPPDFIGPLLPPDFYGRPIPDPKNPGNDRVDRERYAREVMNQFADLQRRNPDKCCKLDACSLAAQWMAESNWGRSGLAKDAKNLGGIKGSGPAGSYNAKTKEFENGTEVQIKDNFRAYNNYPEFYADYANLICRANRYNGARGKKGREYYEALKQSGYSTDPAYADKMMQFYRQLGCK